MRVPIRRDRMERCTRGGGFAHWIGFEHMLYACLTIVSRLYNCGEWPTTLNRAYVRSLRNGELRSSHGIRRSRRAARAMKQKMPLGRHKSRGSPEKPGLWQDGLLSGVQRTASPSLR